MAPRNPMPRVMGIGRHSTFVFWSAVRNLVRNGPWFGRAPPVYRRDDAGKRPKNAACWQKTQVCCDIFVVLVILDRDPICMSVLPTVHAAIVCELHDQGLPVG